MIRFEIGDALKMRGECFLCILERDLEQGYAEHYLYELVMDSPSRDKIVASRGFCNHHFYTMLREAGKPDGTDGQGMALIMKDLNEALIEDIEAQRRSLRGTEESEEPLSARIRFLLQEIKSCISRSKGEKHLVFEEAARRMLSLRDACPACRHIDRFIKVYADDLIDALNEENQEIVEPFKLSNGLCIPHYATVMCRLDEKLPESRKGPVAKQVIEVQLLNMKRLHSEFSEYIRKQDYRFSNEPWGTEKDVVPRGVAKIAGIVGIRTSLESNCRQPRVEV